MCQFKKDEIVYFFSEENNLYCVGTITEIHDNNVTLSRLTWHCIW